MNAKREKNNLCDKTVAEGGPALFRLNDNMKSILVTGAAGFIGANLVLRLLDSVEPACIVGLDSMNDYYDPSLKEYRLRLIEQTANSQQQTAKTWTFVKGSIADKALVDKLFAEHKFDIVVNLAAQAGVRYSIENPDAYIESNIIGFYNILEACRHSMEDGRGKKEDGSLGVQHLVYASSSSVYGGNTKVPFSTKDNVDYLVSFYTATRKNKY